MGTEICFQNIKCFESKLPGYHPMPYTRWGRGPQPGGPGRLPMEPQNAEVEEGECREPAIGLEYKAVEKYYYQSNTGNI